MADAYGMSFGNEENAGMGSGNFNHTLGSPSSGGGENRIKPTEERTVVPATIIMLQRAAKNDLTLDDGRQPDKFKLVCAIREVQKGSTCYTYLVEDGTGLIEVKDWTDDSNIIAAKIREETAVPNKYVRILGSLRTYEGKASLHADCVRMITSGNELTYHLLEVVHAGEVYRQMSSIVGSPMSMPMKGLDLNMEGMNTGLKSSTPVSSMHKNNGDQLTNDIMKYLQRYAGNDTGGSMEDFISQNLAKYSKSDVHSKFNELAAEGHIYSTIDEDHYSAI